jgi:hypothetical protein
MTFIPLATLIVVSLLYRHDLGAKALLVYFSLWLGGLIAAVSFKLVPGYFVAFQCLLAISMLIHVRANPEV